MIYIQDIINQISQSDFERIDLKRAESAQLMNRIDSKYIIPVDQVFNLINSNRNNYFAVEINNQIIHNYYTEYFDTPNLDMYLAHHNRRTNRYKLRVRTYNASGDKFFEIKLKTADGKTRKKRIVINKENGVDQEVNNFIESKSPFKFDELSKTIITDFNRLTLVSKKFAERVTIDLGLAIFTPKNEIANLGYLSIVEIKQDKSKRNSQIGKRLKKMGIRPSGFSKYSIGLAILNKEVKKNSFKKTILKINKLKNE